MYVWRMNDGRWHISLETRQAKRFKDILASPAAFVAYNRGYDTEAEARAAYKFIQSQVAGL